MGGATLPTASTPGYTTFRGLVTCVCLAEWLPVLERLYLAKGLVKSSIDVWQLTGGAPASGGTHTQGGAYDLLYQTTAEHVAVAREMGATGSWGRTVSQGFTRDHHHGALSGCPHNAPAAYQITAQKRGYNGLGRATSGPYAGMWGYGHKDEFPDPSTYRTWREGIAWAEAQIAKLTPPPALTSGGLTVADINTITAQLADLKTAVGDTLNKADGATLRNDLKWQNQQAAKLAGQIVGLSSALTTLAAGKPVDLDAITAAAKAGAQAALDDKIADAVTTLNVNP